MTVGGALADLFVKLTLKDEMSGALDKAVSSTSGVAGKLQAFAPAAMVAGAALTGIGTAATVLIDANREMDASFATTALSMGSTQDEVKELARSLQSVDSPIEEVAATLDLLGRAGMDSIDAMGETASAFDTLADATGNSADGITSAMIPAFNALNVPLEEAPRHIDGLATMFRKSNVDLADFSRVMTRIGPDIGRMGLGLDEVSAIMMSFADRGITGRQATTELDQAITAADGDVRKFFASIGMTEGELAGYTSEIANSAGAAAEFAEAQNSSFGMMDKLGYAFTELKQTAGDLLKPFEGVAAAMIAIGPAILMAVPGIVALVGYLGANGGLAAVLGAAATSAGTFAAGLLTIATGPIGIVVAGVVAIGAAIYLLNERFHFIEGALAWFSDTLKGIGDFLGDTFGPILDGVVGFFGELFTELDTGTGPIESILAAFKGLGEWVGEVGKQIGQVLGPAIKDAASWIGQTFGPAFKAGIGILKEFAGFLVNRFLGQIKDFAAIMGAIWRDAGAWFEALSGGRSVLGVLADGFGIMAEGAGKAWDALAGFADWLGSTFGPIVQPVLDAFGWIGERLGIVGTNAGDAVPKIAGVGDAIATAGTQAGTADQQYDEFGNAVFTAGEEAGTATPAIDGAGTTAATSGTNAATGATGWNTLAGGINTANTAILGFTGSMEEYAKSMENVVRNPPSPIGPGGTTLSPTSSNATPEDLERLRLAALEREATAVPIQTWTYDDDPSGAKRQETEGAAEEYVGVTIVEQFQKDGYWWTRWSDGTVTRGPAVQKTPGARGTIPKFHDGGIYDPAGSSSEGLAWLRAGEAVLTPAQQQTVAGAIADGGSNPETVALLKQIATGIQQLIAATARGTAAVVQAQKSDVDLAQAVAAVQSVRLAQRGGTY